VEQRAQMGRAGRRHVVETADPGREAARLTALMGLASDHERPAAHGAARDGRELDEVVERVPRRR
jgi:hypothetical protein